MSKKTSIVVIVCLALPIASQAAPKLTLEQALLEARSSLEFADGKFSAPGAEVLDQAIADARFVLVGKDHLTREIPMRYCPRHPAT